MDQGDFTARLFFQAHPDPIFIYAHDSLHILEVNRAACQRYGWSRGEFLAMTIAELRPEADVPAILANVALGGEAPPMGVWLHRTKTGQTFPVEARSESILWYDRAAELVVVRALVSQAMQGTALGALLSGEEAAPALDARVRAERILGIGFWSLDPATGALSWSAPVHAIYGLPQHEPPRNLDAYLDRVHPEDRERERAGFRAFLKECPPVLHFEHRIRWPGGRIVHVRGAGAWEKGEPGRLSGVVEDITELRAAEDRERQATDLLRIAGEAARFGGWRVDLSTAVVEWSEATARIHDMPGRRFLPLSDALGHYLTEFRPRIERAFARCASDGTLFDELLQILSASGRRVWVRATGEAVRDAEGRIVQVQGAFQDVSELVATRKRADALAVQLQATIDTMREAFLLVEPDGRVLYANAQARALAGSEATDLAGRPVAGVLPPEIARTLAPFVEAAPAGGLQRDVTLGVAGSARRLRLRLQSTPGALAVMIDDITDEHRTQMALAESEERFRLFAEATREGVWDVDLLGQRRWWNARMVELVRNPAPEDMTVDAAFDARIHPEDHARVREALDAALASDATDWKASYRLLRADGIVIPVADRAIILRDHECRAVRLVGSLSDQRERRALEAHLREAQRMETMGQLTGGLAHEFNNLLTLIMGNADMLRERVAAEPDLVELVEGAIDAAERAAEITERLVATARRQPLQPRPLDLRDALADLAPILRGVLPGAIALEIAPGEVAMPVELDPIQLENAIINIVLNARDAMPEGDRLVLRLFAADMPAAGGAARDGVGLALSDDGTGMAPEIAARIFEPFFSTRPGRGGKGLGLSVVEGFVHRSGGEIRIETAPGRGTTVILVFPRAAIGADVVAVDGHATGDVHVLLVEDDDRLHAQIGAQLRALGHRVSATTDGPSALRLLESDSSIALLFTDVLMPGGLNGGDLAARARRLRPGLPVLFTSGYVADALIAEGRLPEAEPLLPKPFRRADLARMLDRALGRDRE